MGCSKSDRSGCRALLPPLPLLTNEGSENRQKSPTRFGEEPSFKGGLVIKGRHVADSEEADLTEAVWGKRMEYEDQLEEVEEGEVEGHDSRSDRSSSIPPDSSQRQQFGVEARPGFQRARGSLGASGSTPPILPLPRGGMIGVKPPESLATFLTVKNPPPFSLFRDRDL